MFYSTAFQTDKPFYMGISFPSSLSTEDRLAWVNNAIISNKKELERHVIARTLGYQRTLLNSEHYPNGFFNYEDILLLVEPSSAEQLIVINPLDNEKPTPTSIYVMNYSE